MSTREPPLGTSWRAVAKRKTSGEVDALWHGRWKPQVGAHKQARRWAARDDIEAVWLQEGSYDGVGRIVVVSRVDVTSSDGSTHTGAGARGHTGRSTRA